MNHKKLHELLSRALDDLEKDRINADKAKEMFVGGGKLISNCKNAIKAVEMGFEVDIPLLDITKEDVKKKFVEDKKNASEGAIDKIRKRIKF